MAPPPLPLKKVTKMTRIADIDLKVSELKNKWKGDQESVPP